jgi:hypothetical protein
LGGVIELRWGDWGFKEIVLVLPNAIMDDFGLYYSVIKCLQFNNTQFQQIWCQGMKNRSNYHFLEAVELSLSSKAGKLSKTSSFSP